MIREGFWSADNMPIANPAPWNGREKFLLALMAVEACSEVRQYRGSSTCRVCHRSNGSQEYHTPEAEWPSGLRHYVQDHNVRPSQTFIDYIINLSI